MKMLFDEYEDFFNYPEKFVDWLKSQKDLTITVQEAEMLLGYFQGHDYEFIVNNVSLFLKDIAEPEGNIEKCTFKQVVELAMFWNCELQQDTENEGYYRQLKEDEKCLDELFKKLLRR